MELHHDKHHAGYVKGANTALERLHDLREKGDFSTISMLEKNLAFNVSGHVLHSVFWTNLSPDGGGKPEGDLADLIDATFGGFPAFRQQMTEAAIDDPRRRLGARVVGAGRGTPRRPTGARPPGQPRTGHDSATRDRRVGARLLPAVREPEGRLLRSGLERRQLGRRRATPRRGSARKHHFVAGPREMVMIIDRPHTTASSATDRSFDRLFSPSLGRCPACGSRELEPVVEEATDDVHFFCGHCERCWRVELGFAHPIAPEFVQRRTRPRRTTSRRRDGAANQQVTTRDHPRHPS